MALGVTWAQLKLLPTRVQAGVCDLSAGLSEGVIILDHTSDHSLHVVCRAKDPPCPWLEILRVVDACESWKRTWQSCVFLMYHGGEVEV